MFTQVKEQAANSDRATHVREARAGGSKHLVWSSVFILRFVKNENIIIAAPWNGLKTKTKSADGSNPLALGKH